MDENPRLSPEEIKATARARSQESLLQFIRNAWPVLEPGTTFVGGNHIDAIVAHLEAVTAGEIQNLLINIPPRHMKSLAVCVFWPVWEWITKPHHRWLFASYARSLSVRDSLRCRRLILSPWFQYNWGDRFQLMYDQNTKDRFDNDRGGCRIATSVGGSVTGEGGDRVVVDDPHNVIHRDSDSVRRAALDWWDQAMSTRLNDPKTGAKVIVMQRLHENDLSQHVLAQGEYQHLYLPAEFEPSRKCYVKATRWQDWRTREGELLWPGRVGEAEIADFKLRLGPNGYAGQFQQRPVPAGGARFRREWFRYYTIVSLDGEVIYQLPQSNGAMKLVRADDCTRFAVMDPAGTERDQNDRACFTVIQVWDVTESHEMLLVYQYRRQVQTPDATRALTDISRDFEVDYVAVEKDGLGLGIIQNAMKSGVTVKPVRARGCKEARSEIAEIRMAAGMIYFPRDSALRIELERELVAFPKSEHSDQVDALAYAAMIVQRRAGPPGTEGSGANASNVEESEGESQTEDNDDWE